MPEPSGPMLEAHYLDGQSTQLRVVQLSVEGSDLVVSGEDVALRVPFASIRVDERLGRAPRRLRLDANSFCEVRDLNGLDELLRLAGHADGWVDRIQRRFRFVALALIACAVLVFSCYYWVLPYCADLIAQRLPPMVGESLSAQVLKILDGGVLQPSALSAPRRRALTDALHGLTLPGGGRPTSVLVFRRSPQLGANAFTLPDGTIVVLDDLVTTIGSDPQILAVFAHELGHAQARHSLQLLLRGTVVGGFLALYLGDVSQLLAAAPAAFLQARFSQDFERQADDYASAVLVRNGMSPGLLADALEKLAAQHPERAGGGYLASHPATAERIRRLRDLAAAQ